MPQSRDRRPRLETPPSLPQGEERLTVTYLNGSFYPKGCHKVGTDALVCPHREAACNVRWNIGADRRGRLSLLCGIFFFLVLLFQLTRQCLVTCRPTLPFLCKRYYLLPSPFGEGTGVRLLLSPLGRLGGVIPFGEGAGGSLLLYLTAYYSVKKRSPDSPEPRLLHDS